jgi:hypothetical protein
MSNEILKRKGLSKTQVSTSGDAAAAIPWHYKNAGTHVGRVAVRVLGSFNADSATDINGKHLHLIQRSDGTATPYRLRHLTR